MPRPTATQASSSSSSTGHTLASTSPTNLPVASSTSPATQGDQHHTFLTPLHAIVL
jgi:hypothetical protein